MRIGHYRMIFIYFSSFIFFASCSNYKNDQKQNIEKVLLSGKWEVFNSVINSENGSDISQLNYTAKESIEALLPTTIFHAQVSNGMYEDIYMGKNMGEISKEPYEHAWWYRQEFEINKTTNYYELKFDGINYKANIWLNGNLIADTNEVNNAFKMYRFQVSKYLNSGQNVLAVQVFPPKSGDFSIGFVDWNPAPPDHNMGIFRPVKLRAINKVQILEPYVENIFTNNDYSKVKQNVSLSLKNYTDNDIDGTLFLEIYGKSIKRNVHLPASSTKKIDYLGDEYEALNIKDPKLWWPHTLGEPVLHDAKFRFVLKGEELAIKEMRYGIREIKDYYTEEGHRGFLINGEKISIRGAGWVDNIMLDNTHDYDLAQLEYVKNMNLNTIRMEGFWGKDDYLYKTCDELGIIVMVGWSCHWEWEDYLGKHCDEKYGGILNDWDVELMSTAWRDQIVWLRNHPSIIAWFSGSDCVPIPALEKRYAETFFNYDSSRVYLSSAKEWETEELQTGMKMRGPYAYVPPVYWFADTLYGGAFGFNTETGPGAQVPPLESIKKMIPEEDLWPMNSVWDFHCGRNEFNDLSRYTKALNERYGKAHSVEEYAKKAQVLNYELMRPMFEAFSANRYKATGVIQWMLNSAWPEMYWQLYDSYLMPNGAFYATKKAGEPLHALYNYHDQSIYLVNDQLNNEENIKVDIRLYDTDSKLLYKESIRNDILKNSSLQVLQLKDVLDFTSSVVFLDLRVLKGNNEMANNFYWLSKKADVLDYQATLPSWYYHTPSKQYADFTALNTMKKVSVKYSMTEASDNDNSVFNIEVENLSEQIAFFIELRMLDKNTQSSILPALWSDNYISLLPKEKRLIEVKIKNSYLVNKVPQLTVDGYNLK